MTVSVQSERRTLEPLFDLRTIKVFRREFYLFIILVGEDILFAVAAQSDKLVDGRGDVRILKRVRCSHALVEDFLAANILTFEL